MAHQFDALLKRLEHRRADRGRRTSYNSHGREFGGLYPPASAATIQSAEKDLGFPLPPLLREIYQNLANGGFGPGLGLVGLSGGYTFEDFDELNLVQYHRMLVSPPPEEFEWPPRLLNIAHNGCLFFYAVDCSTPDFPVILLEAHTRKCVAPTFSGFMERWAEGLPDPQWA